MQTPSRIALPLAGLIALSVLAACGPRPESSAPPAQRSEESFKEVGPYEVHYNAVRSDQIPASVARAHNIERSKNRVMLNVTILRKEADGAPRRPVKGTVSVDAYNLTGQLKNIEMRQVTEGEAIYYLGTVPITGNEILVFDIKATPENETVPIEVKMKREFYAD